MNDRIPLTNPDGVLAGVKAKPSGWPTASLDPDSGHRPEAMSGTPANTKPQFQVSTVSGDCRETAEAGRKTGKPSRRRRRCDQATCCGSRGPRTAGRSPCVWWEWCIARRGRAGPGSWRSTPSPGSPGSGASGNSQIPLLRVNLSGRPTMLMAEQPRRVLVTPGEVDGCWHRLTTIGPHRMASLRSLCPSIDAPRCSELCKPETRTRWTPGHRHDADDPVDQFLLAARLCRIRDVTQPRELPPAPTEPGDDWTHEPRDALGTTRPGQSDRRRPTDRRYTQRPCRLQRLAMRHPWVSLQGVCPGLPSRVARRRHP